MNLPALLAAAKKQVRETARFNYRILNNQQAVVTVRPGGRSRGNVLLSYTTRPFRISESEVFASTHSNVWSCREMARAWNELGFTVDVIDWDNRDFVPLKDYDFFIDIHSNMERLAPLLGKDCVKILHVTGTHWAYQNAAEYRRLYAIQRRRGVSLYPRRMAPPSLGIEHADHVAMIGNSFTESTFRYAGKPAVLLPNPTTVAFPPLARDLAQCRKRFLWLGSIGLALKGLDLVLEAFAAMPDCSLTVIGPVSQEKDFEAAFHKELYETPNIRTVGSLDTGGEQFEEIARACVGIVYPSFSEGQSGSVITCMHAGLIPVVSYESGVDTGAGGIVLRDVSVTVIQEQSAAIGGMQDEETPPAVGGDAGLRAGALHAGSLCPGVPAVRVLGPAGRGQLTPGAVNMGFGNSLKLAGNMVMGTVRLNFRAFRNQRKIATLPPAGESKGTVLMSYILKPFLVGGGLPI